MNKEISGLSINQAIKLLPKKIGDRRLELIPGCAGQMFNVSYRGESGFGPTAWNYTLGKAIRSMLRKIKCNNCGTVVEEDQECGRPATWQVGGDDYHARVYCSKKCKKEKLLGGVK